MSIGKNQFIRVSKVDAIGMPHQMTFQGPEADTLSTELFSAWRDDKSNSFVGRFDYMGAGTWVRRFEGSGVN